MQGPMRKAVLPTLKPGEKPGRYQLRSPIGAGGVGEV